MDVDGELQTSIMESKGTMSLRMVLVDINSKFKSFVGRTIHDPQNFKLLPNDSITNRDSPLSHLCS